MIAAIGGLGARRGAPPPEPSPMRAIVLRDQVEFVDDYPTPVPAPGEALIRVSLAGICGTDLELVEGYHNFQGVLGHEFVGVVEQAPEPGWAGQRVVGEINLGCGHCETCRTRGPNHCPERRVLGILHKDGAFAEYLTLPVGNLHRVPDDLPDQAAVLCEPLAAALRISEQLQVVPGERAAVLGPGRLGLLVGLVLQQAGAEVAALGRSQRSLSTAEALGLKAALAAGQPANGFDLVVDATGNPTGLAAAIELCRPEGRLVLKSTFRGPAAVDTSAVVVKELTVVGSRCGPFAPALELLAAGHLPVALLLGDEHPLEAAKQALDAAGAPGVGKVTLRP